MRELKTDERVTKFVSEMNHCDVSVIVIYNSNKSVNVVGNRTYDNSIHFVTAHIINEFKNFKDIKMDKEYLESIEYTINKLKNFGV